MDVILVKLPVEAVPLPTGVFCNPPVIDNVVNAAEFGVVAPMVPLNGPLSGPLCVPVNVVAVTVVNAPVLAVLAPIAPVKYPEICPPFTVATEVNTPLLGLILPTAPVKFPENRLANI